MVNLEQVSTWRGIIAGLGTVAAALLPELTPMIAKASAGALALLEIFRRD